MKFYDKKTKEWKEQYRAKRKQGSLDKMKSKVANLLLDRSHDYEKIDGFIRGAVHHKKNEGVNFSTNRKTKKLFFKALSHMPSDLRQWKYGYQTINKARPFIDEMVDVYLNTYHKDEMKELNKLLDKQVEISERLYGESSRHEQFKKTKLEDLKKRMGNAVLMEMRNYMKAERAQVYQKGRKKNYQTNRRLHSSFGNWKKGSDVHYAISKLSYAMRKTYHEYQKDRNIEEFDRMMDGYDR